MIRESPFGSLLTFAEHKGYALAAMCEILGGRFPAVKRRVGNVKNKLRCHSNCMTTVCLKPELLGAPDCNAQTEALPSR
ncbi:hypothetical protein ACNKHW_04860 [Shigella flexneri]